MALKESADALLRGAVEKGDVPGVVALATTGKGTTYEAGFGERALGGGVPMTPDTVVWIASMTKAVTATAAMQQIERGRLALDGAAAQWVPALGQVQVLDGFDAGGKPKLRAPKRPITLRHLLTHTAGFAYEIWSPEIIRYQQATGTPGIITCTNAALVTPLLFDPGERWMYGINIDWIGRIVEAVGGQRLGAYMTENIFAPLGMSDTAFKITPAMRARLAKIHQRGDDGALQPLDLELTQEPELEMGGGGLYSTAGDYAKFVRMILNRGTGERGRVLKPETVDLMSRNAMGDKRVVKLPSAIPPLSNDAEFFPGSSKSWGLSFMINDDTAPTGRSAGSLAWAGLANTFYWIDRTKGVGGVYLTPILPFADVKSAPLYLAFETAVYRTM